MYYRRKILLSLLDIFGGELEKLRLQRLLMLLSKSQETPSFDFVPHKHGCFSFRANADLKTLSKYEQVSDQNKAWKKTEVKSYVTELRRDDKQALTKLKKNYEGKSLEELVEIINKEYPFYSVSSKIHSFCDLGKAHHNSQNSSDIEEEKASYENRLFTIGYEGVSLETYLNKLIINDVKFLLDVRRNSTSMKYGFSKRQLREACQEVNIKYYHLPELGIASDKRKDLKTQSDYDQLFENYRKVNLQSTTETQREVIDLIRKYRRVALTCFEADVCQCHRKPLAESISRLSNFSCEVKHI